jgi:hypothetical protein
MEFLFMNSDRTLQLLRKEYLGTSLSTLPPEEQTKLLRSHIAVLDVMQAWIKNGGGAMDIINSSDLRTTVNSFLTSCSQMPSSASQDPVVVQLVQAQASALLSLHRTFLNETRRPSILDAGAPVPLGHDPSVPVVVPNVDSVTAQDIVSWLDTSAQAAFGSILEEV